MTGLDDPRVASMFSQAQQDLTAVGPAVFNQARSLFHLFRLHFNPSCLRSICRLLIPASSPSITASGKPLEDGAPSGMIFCSAEQ